MQAAAEPMGSRVRRRMMTVPLLTLMTVAAVALFPVFLPSAFLVDLVRRRRFALSRAVLFFTYYLLGETTFVMSLFVHWLVVWSDRKARLARFAQARSDGWGIWLERGAEICFGIRIETEGLAELDPRDKTILFLRHVSIGDTVIPPVVFGRKLGMKVRYIAKRELQMDPIFDIIGGRIAVCFVDRGSGKSDVETAPMRQMANELIPGELLALYPEGTRFTDKKLARAKVSAQKALTPELAERALRLENVMPPRLGGALAILDAAPADAVLVIATHVGYEGTRSLRDLLSGRVVGRQLRVRFFRFPVSELPADRDARALWLFDRWVEIDQWIGTERRRLYPNEVKGALEADDELTDAGAAEEPDEAARSLA